MLHKLLFIDNGDRFQSDRLQFELPEGDLTELDV